MKKQTVCCLLIIAGINVASAATLMNNFTQIEQAISSGYHATIVLDGRCADQPENAFSASYKPKDIVATAQSIVTSNWHFTTNDPVSQGKPAYEYVLYQINQDESVTVTTTVYDPTTFKVIGTAPKMACPLSQGADVYITAY